MFLRDAICPSERFMAAKREAHLRLVAGFSRPGQGRAGFAAAHGEKLGKTCLLTPSAKPGRMGPQ